MYCKIRFINIIRMAYYIVLVIAIEELSYM